MGETGPESSDFRCEVMGWNGELMVYLCVCRCVTGGRWVKVALGG